MTEHGPRFPTRGTSRALAVSALCLVVCAAAFTPAAASRRVAHGRGPAAQAAMYATVLDGHPQPIQVLDRLCAKPRHQKRCAELDGRLQHAISVAVDRPLTWVDAVQPHGGVFWVLSRIRLRTDRANFDYTWTELRPYGCLGAGYTRFRRVKGSWIRNGGTSSEGCP